MEHTVAKGDSLKSTNGLVISKEELTVQLENFVLKNYRIKKKRDAMYQSPSSPEIDPQREAAIRIHEKIVEQNDPLVLELMSISSMLTCQISFIRDMLVNRRHEKERALAA